METCSAHIGKVTASIVVYDSSDDEMRKVVDSLSRDSVDRLWILYNGPDPDRAEALATLAPSCRKEGSGMEIEVRRIDNNGFGAGHNIAIREAMASGSRYHLVVNADVSWEGQAVAPLLEEMESDSEIGLIAPKVVYPDGSLQYTCRMLPTPADMLRRMVARRDLPQGRNGRYLLSDLDHSRPMAVPYILGCFMLFRVDALRDAGLFDERYFMYPEDIDITRRIARRWKTLYSPVATVTHFHHRASKTSWRMRKIHIKNMVDYFNKWGWFFDSERRRLNRGLRH